MGSGRDVATGTKIPNYRYVVERMQCTRDMVSSGRASQGEAMVAVRRVITLSIDPGQHRALVDISRSRTEATPRGAGSNNHCLPRYPVGLRRRAADWGKPADGDALPGASR